MAWMTSQQRGQSLEFVDLRPELLLPELKASDLLEALYQEPYVFPKEHILQEHLTSSDFD